MLVYNINNRINISQHKNKKCLQNESFIIDTNFTKHLYNTVEILTKQSSASFLIKIKNLTYLSRNLHP